MKKYASIKKRSSQLFLSTRTQTFLKLASIYDEFGDYNMAECIQSEAFKYSKFIRVAQDLSEDDAEPDYKDKTTDINEDANNIEIGNARQYFQSMTNPQLYDPIISHLNEETQIGRDYFHINPSMFGLNGKSTTYIENYTNPNVVKTIIKYLSLGGNNVYNSLKSLADFIIGTDEIDSDVRGLLFRDSMTFNKTLSMALATYYKCPEFLFHHYSSIMQSAKVGLVDSSDVESILYIIGQYKKEIDDSISLREKIKNLLPETPNDPELTNRIISYFFRKYSQSPNILDEIPSYDIRKLSLAVIHGFNDFTTIDYKYFALTHLPENVVMSVIDKSLSELDATNITPSGFLCKLTGFDLSMMPENPLYKIFLNYLEKNPFVGQAFRSITYSYFIKLNDFLLYANLIPADKIDSYLSQDFRNYSPNVDTALGPYLQDLGIFSDYDSTFEEMENLSNRSIRKNVNTYLFYKANKEKALKCIELYGPPSNINFTMIDPEKFMDYALANPTIKKFAFIPESLILAYNNLGDRIFEFPPAILSRICEYLQKQLSYNDPKKYEKYIKIIDLNPNFNSYSADEQEYALEFYSLNEAYTNIPYEKIKNFCDFTGIQDRTVAANHLFVFGEFTPEWVDVTPRNLGSKASISFLKKMGDSIKKDGFLLGEIERISPWYDKLSEEDKNRPISELAFVCNSRMSLEDINEQLKKLDEVKLSFEKAVRKNPAYAKIEPGSRDYYYLIYYFMKNFDLRGQNPNSFLILRDLFIKKGIYENIGFDVSDKRNLYTTTVMSDLNLERNTSNFKKIKKIAVRVITLTLRYPITDQQMVFIIKNVYEKFPLRFDEIDEEIKKLAEQIFLDKTITVDPTNLVDFSDLETSLEDVRLIEHNLTDSWKMSNENTNVTSAVAIFGNLLLLALDQFARNYCKSKLNISIKSMNDVPASNLSDVLSAFKDSLPGKNQKYVGFAQYYQSQFRKSEDLGVLKRIGENWNVNLKTFDDRNRVVSIEPLSKLASRYRLQDLNNLLSMTIASHIIENFQDCDRKFLTAYCQYDSAYGNKSQRFDFDNCNEGIAIDRNYQYREQAYLHGLSIPLPAWASYRNSIVKPDTNEKITLRFLPRDDPRGMYLGVIASCCQHPDGQAATCAIDGHVNPKAAFMVIELKNKIIAEAYTWEDNNGNICLDSIETVGNEAYYSDKNKEIVRELLIQFGNAQSNCMVNVGNNNFDFDHAPITMSNNTKAYEEFAESLPYENFYIDDHQRQFSISDTRNTKYNQYEYNRINPVRYSGDLCPLCGNMSLNDGECSACDYDENDYSNCPKCNNTTLDENGICQAEGCSFTYETCLKCQENRYNPEDGECDYCGYSKDSHEFCPLCEEQTLDGDECVNSDCNYNASNYEECPDCEEYTVEDGTCFKCGRDLEEDEEELEVEDDD
jgi:hypothetical protein